MEYFQTYFSTSVGLESVSAEALMGVRGLDFAARSVHPGRSLRISDSLEIVGFYQGDEDDDDGFPPEEKYWTWMHVLSMLRRYCLKNRLKW